MKVPVTGWLRPCSLSATKFTVYSSPGLRPVCTKEVMVLGSCAVMPPSLSWGGGERKNTVKSVEVRLGLMSNACCLYILSRCSKGGVHFSLNNIETHTAVIFLRPHSTLRTALYIHRDLPLIHMELLLFPAVLSQHCTCTSCRLTDVILKLLQDSQTLRCEGPHLNTTWNSLLASQFETLKM